MKLAKVRIDVFLHHLYFLTYHTRCDDVDIYVLQTEVILFYTGVSSCLNAKMFSHAYKLLIFSDSHTSVLLFDLKIYPFTYSPRHTCTFY